MSLLHVYVWSIIILSIFISQWREAGTIGELEKKSPCNEEFHALKKSLCWLNEGRKVAGLDLDNDTPDINKGRFALASSQEDINISKLLWKEYLRDLILLGNIWIAIINGIKKSQCSNFCQAPEQKKTESWNVIGKYLNCEPDLWMPWRNTEVIKSMCTFLNGKNSLKYLFPK